MRRLFHFITFEVPNMRGLLACSLVALACLQAACTAPVRPDHLAQQDKRSLGRIAVVAARFQPKYVFDADTTGKGSAAGGGAAVGAVEGLRCGIFFVICSPVGAIIGASVAASRTATAEKIEAAKAAAQREINALKLHETTLEAVLRYGKDEGVDLGRLPEGMGPAKQADLPSYSEAKDVAGTVIEVSVLNARAVTTGAKDLRIGLGMQARVRVLSTRDGKEIDTLTIRAESKLRTLDEWLAADGQAIRTAFQRGAALIAEHALDEILLVYHPRQMPPQPETGSKEPVPPYALRAIEPPIRSRGSVLVPLPPANAVGSLQPEFRWEPWPRGFDIFPGSGPGQAREVRYDLRIFGAEGVAYERRGLAQTAHHLERPLNPCRGYQWTVRARFLLNGAPRATEWTGVYDDVGDTLSGAVAPWWFRRGSDVPGLTLFRRTGLEWYYPWIITPGPKGEALPGSLDDGTPLVRCRSRM